MSFSPQRPSSANSGSGATNRNAHEYKPEEEALLKIWAERASVYRVLHHLSWDKYRNFTRMFTIPVIVLSTIAGTANWAQGEVPYSWAPFIIGTVNILCGILTTIAQFMRYSELQESHRVASLGWGKYHRNLSAELARSPLDRSPVFELMRLSKQEFERLSEISPPIDTDILRLFEIEYGQEMPQEISRPEILDGFRPVTVYHNEPQTARASIDQEAIVRAAQALQAIRDRNLLSTPSAVSARSNGILEVEVTDDRREDSGGV